MMAQSQSQAKKPEKNILWGGRFTGSSVASKATCSGCFAWGGGG